MINTYNESSLHHTLKILYAQKFKGTTEVKWEKWVCDILTDEGNIIEIQTGAVSALKEKIKAALKAGKKITIVQPVIISKTIETKDKNDRTVSCRKSPKTESIYTKLKGLTGIYEFLLHKNFDIRFLEAEIKEERSKEETKVQLKNKSRRFKKDYVICNKRLLSLGKEVQIKTKKDYLKLLPQLNETFCSKDLKNAYLAQNYHKDAVKNSNLILWLLCHMGIITKVEKPSDSRGKTLWYSKTASRH